MYVIPLGAGQDIGKSCILVSIKDKTIMFDCGMHMGFTDKRKFPDFSYFKKTDDINQVLDCIIISHFHIDHCGALPYFTEVLNYNGPIFMTAPTKAVLPIILEDSRKILEMKNNGDRIFTQQQIRNCMKKIITININETYHISNDFYIRPYYAGHVIGAAMFYVYNKGQSVVYTGDFSTLADKHLRSAQIDSVKPDLLITESTYGGVLRECKKVKEREMLQVIQETIDKKGKVLIPIFALGRAQEICLLIDNYWERMNLKVPVYFATGLTEQVNDVYSRFSNFTNQTIQKKLEDKNVFTFKCAKPFYKTSLDIDEPALIFATPAMLHSGSSLAIFKQLCKNENNAVILPGYCSRGTVGEHLLSGMKRIAIGKEIYDVKMKVHNIAFSAHADMTGIIKIIDQCKPKNIMLVHGELTKMKALRNKIKETKDIPVFMPQIGSLIEIPTSNDIKIKIEKKMLEKHVDLDKEEQEIEVMLDIEYKNNEIVAKNIDELNL